MTLKFCFQAYQTLSGVLHQENYNTLANYFRKVMIEAAVEQKFVYSLDSAKAKKILAEINNREKVSTSPLRYWPRKTLTDVVPFDIVLLPENKFVWLNSGETIENSNKHYWSLLLLSTLNCNPINVILFLNNEYEKSENKASFLKYTELIMRDAYIGQVVSDGMIETIKEWIISKNHVSNSNFKRIRPGKSTRVKEGWTKGVFIFMEILQTTQSSSFCYDCDQNEIAEALAILSRASFDSLEQEYPKVKRRKSKYVFDADAFTQVRNMLNAFQAKLTEIELDYKVISPVSQKKVF